MEKLLKIDPHVHSSKISTCSHVTVEEIIDEKQKRGYDGAVLTNHCQSWYYPPAEHKYYIERVIEEFQRGKAYADKKNFRLFLGLEVTLENPRYADWLLYGVSEEFLRATPCLYQLTQRELFALCEEWGVVLIQAHPFRARQMPGEPEFMHGVEINCSHSDLENTKSVQAFAALHDLLVTCGTDYHFPQNTYFGGILLPEYCHTAQDIAKHIREAGYVDVIMEGEITRYSSGVFGKE